MLDALTIGSATHDVFLFSDRFQLLRSKEFETGVGECVPLGSKIDVDRKVESTGGGATNAAVTFARLGFGVAAVCRVGDDTSGDHVVANLAREGVGVDLIRRVQGGETGYSALLTTGSGERSVLVYRGVSSTFDDGDIPWNQLNARAVYLTTLAGNVALSTRIIREGAQAGAMVAWNPGRGELATGLAALTDALSLVSFLLVNREEAAELTGKSDPVDAYRILAKAGVGGAVIITDGANGACAFFRTQGWRAGTTGAQSVSRTGAGDAFGSGTVAALLKGWTLPDAVAAGTLNAESVVSDVGAKRGILAHFPDPQALRSIPIEPITFTL